MRLIDVYFKPESFVKEVEITLSGTQILFHEENLSEEVWLHLQDDLQKNGVQFTPNTQPKMLFIPELSNANDVIIGTILTRLGAMETSDLLHIQCLFLKNFCMYLHIHMTQPFRDTHPELNTLLEQFKNDGITPEHIRQIPLLLKQLPENGVAVHNNAKMQEEYPLFLDTLKNVHTFYYQSFLDLAKQKLFLQALANVLPEEKIQSIDDKGIQQFFGMLHQLPPEIAFKVIDWTNPEFPNIKTSNTILQSYQSNETRWRDLVSEQKTIEKTSIGK